MDDAGIGEHVLLHKPITSQRKVQHGTFFHGRIRQATVQDSNIEDNGSTSRNVGTDCQRRVLGCRTFLGQLNHIANHLLKTFIVVCSRDEFSGSIFGTHVDQWNEYIETVSVVLCCGEEAWPIAMPELCFRDWTFL
jgi:hypothetical protein